MFKVLDVFPIGNMFSVTLEGSCDGLKNGSRLTDNNGNTVVVASVAMTKYENPTDFNKNTTVMVDSCQFTKGSELFIV